MKRPLHFFKKAGLKLLISIITLFGTSLFAEERVKQEQCRSFYTPKGRSIETDSTEKGRADDVFRELARVESLNRYQRAREGFLRFDKNAERNWSVLEAGSARGSGSFQMIQGLLHHGIGPMQPNIFADGIFESSMKVLIFRGLGQEYKKNDRAHLSFPESLKLNLDSKMRVPFDDGWNLLVHPDFLNSNGGWSFRENLSVLPVIKDRALSELYADYAHQGPERSENLQKYQYQDTIGAERTLGFAVTIGPAAATTVLGHIQLKTSMGPEQPHNFETNFSPIDRPTNTKSVELGRLFLDLLGWDKRDWLINDWLKHKYISNFVRYSLYQKALSWLSWDYQPEVAYAQVNTEKKDKFMNRRSPFKFSSAKVIDGTEGKEWLLTMNRQDMRRSEDNANVEVLLALIDGYYEFVSKKKDQLIVKFDRNQFASLERIGLLEWSQNLDPQNLSGENYQRYLYSGRPIRVSRDELLSNSFLLIEFPKAELMKLQAHLNQKSQFLNKPLAAPLDYH